MTSAFFSYIRFSVIQLANDELMNLIYFISKSEGIWGWDRFEVLIYCSDYHFLHTMQFIISDGGSQTVVSHNCVIHLPPPLLITLVRLNLLPGETGYLSSRVKSVMLSSRSAEAAWLDSLSMLVKLWLCVNVECELVETAVWKSSEMLRYH